MLSNRRDVNGARLCVQHWPTGAQAEADFIYYHGVYSRSFECQRQQRR